MVSNFIKLLLLITTSMGIVGLVGCRQSQKLVTSYAPSESPPPTLSDSFLKIASPSECEDWCEPGGSGFQLDSISPNALMDYKSIEHTPVSLSECIQRALADSEVFRELGGAIVGQPAAVDTALDPALVFADPRQGEQAALSAFDANIATSLFYEGNDRPFNNRFSGNTDGILNQDLAEYQLEFSKLAATGTQFNASQTLIYDNNNQAGNRFQGSYWEAMFDAGFRHPLLQGSGTLFNRIAGPSQIPGQYNGVLIARTNTEISLAEFEQSTRRFIANVENAYWDLYYAYRELNAQTDARDAAYEVFKRTEAQAGSERISGLEKASAEEQYLRFEAAIVESLEGRTIDGTRADSGAAGGSFRRTVGVRVAERRLRYLIGMPITDGTLLQPSDKPSRAPVVFDWGSSVSSAVNRRPETRRQRWVVKQRELELTAARNFLLPRLDLVGNYRFRGLGKDLTGGDTLGEDIQNGTEVSSAFGDLFGGDFQEVQFGAEFRMPVGYRQANSAVRSAELGVQRARKVLDEQERKILLDLSNAIAETRRAYSAMDVARRRFDAAVEYRKQAAARIQSGRSQMDVLLEAQRRILEAQVQFINAEVEYTQAIKNVHFERSSYLGYHGISLQESESDPQAYADASDRYSRRIPKLNYISRDPTIANPQVVPGVGSVSTVPMMDPSIGAPVAEPGLPSIVTEEMDSSGLPPVIPGSQLEPEPVLPGDSNLPTAPPESGTQPSPSSESDSSASSARPTNVRMRASTPMPAATDLAPLPMVRQVATNESATPKVQPQAFQAPVVQPQVQSTSGSVTSRRQPDASQTAALPATAAQEASGTSSRRRR